MKIYSTRLEMLLRLRLSLTLFCAASVYVELLETVAKPHDPPLLKKRKKFHRREQSCCNSLWLIYTYRPCTRITCLYKFHTIFRHYQLLPVATPFPVWLQLQPVQPVNPAVCGCGSLWPRWPPSCSSVSSGAPGMAAPPRWRNVFELRDQCR